MGCIASLSGLPNPFNLLPGQTATYTVAVTIPNTTICNCGSSINTISATVSSGFAVTLSNLPSLPLSGYCGTPFNIDVTVTALPTAIPGTTGVVTIEFDNGATPLQYGYIALNVVAITAVGQQVINLGEVCPGELVNIPICNLSSEAEVFTLTQCGCDDFNLDCDDCVTELDLNACECGNFVVELDTQTEGELGCDLTVTTATGYSQRIRVLYTVVPCDFAEVSWSLEDVNDHVGVSNADFDTDCDLFQFGAIGEKKIFQRVLDLASPVELNQQFYFASWQFAPLPNWGFEFPGKPPQGWHCTVCEVGLDGTYPMEWYGSQHCYENGSVTLTVSNSGTRLTIDYSFYLMADLVGEPNSLFIENHDYLLRSSLANPQELQNDADNSVYKTQRYFMTVLTTEIPSSGTWQRDDFRMKCNLVWYGENTITPAVILSDVMHEFTIPGSTQETDFVSSVRNTKLRIEFDYVCNDPTGTVPTDAWLVAFRTDTRNNLLDPLENYVIANADLTNNVPDGIISAIVTPPTYISGNRFYAEVTIDDCPGGATPDLATLASYRFILLTHTANLTDKAVRTQISREVLSINYDDLDFTFTGLVRTLNLADQKYSTNALIVPVNAQTEVEIGVPLGALDTEISAKTGGVITDALSALRAVYLNVYYLAGNVRVNLFNPFMTRRGDFWINDSEQRNNEALVNRSISGYLNFVFPFTMPDNILRQATRANYQSNTDRNALNSLQEVLDCQPGISLTLPDLTGIIAPEYMAYVPDTNEVWVAGVDSSNPSNGGIYAIDLSNNLAVSQIITIGSDIPLGMLYVPGVGVMASFPTSGAIRFYYPTTRTAITTISIGAGASQMIYLNVQNEVWVACSGSNDVYRVNPSTQTVIGSPLTLTIGDAPEALTYVDTIDEVWVACTGASSVKRINRSTFTVTGAPIATTSPLPKSILFSSAGDVWVCSVADIDVISISTFAIINTINNPGQAGNGITENAGIIYANDTASDLIRLYDSTLFTALSTYATGTQPKRIYFAPGVLLVGNGGDDSVTPYLLPPCPEVPNYSASLRDIYAEWRFQFQVLGNEENYYYKVAFPRVRERDAEPIDDIKYEEYDDATDNWVEIENPCPDTGRMRIEVDFTNNQTFLGIAIEQQPVRNNRLTEKSLPSTNIIPVESEYISNITTTADKIQFEFDYPNWIANGAEKSPGEAYQDYEFYIHILAK